METKVKNRLAKFFENFTPEQFGAALTDARHVLKGEDEAAKPEARLVVEYIEGLGLAKDKIKLPEKLKVTCVKSTKVDGVQFSPDQTGEITIRQYKALARFFTIEDEESKKALVAHYEAEKAKRKGTGVATAILIGFFLLIGGIKANAQTYKQTAINGLNGGTNNIAASTTTSQQKVTATKFKNFCLQLNCALNAAGTSALTITEYHSGDGTNYSATGATTSVNANGTTAVTLTWERTNMVAGYYSYTIQNGNSAAAVTNLAFLLIDPGAKDL